MSHSSQNAGCTVTYAMFLATVFACAGRSPSKPRHLHDESDPFCCHPMKYQACFGVGIHNSVDIVNARCRPSSGRKLRVHHHETRRSCGASLWLLRSFMTPTQNGAPMSMKYVELALARPPTSARRRSRPYTEESKAR